MEVEFLEGIQGLTGEQAEKLKKQYGPNEAVPEKKKGFIRKLLETLTEPMFLLLLIAAVIYFVLGEPTDGSIMLVFVVGIIGIELRQSWKTDKTLEALRELSSPRVRAVRDGRVVKLDSRDLVPGDIMIVEEGEKLAADGVILRQSDLCVDESMLTGEAESVWKGIRCELEDSYWRKDTCYAATIVTQGSGIIQVTHTGVNTEYGKIGKGIAEAPDRPTPLEKQTSKVVKVAFIIGLAFFLLVAMVTWNNFFTNDMADRFIHSILAGVTLAMAMIPEEFPVILTVFLSVGAARLARQRALVRRLSSVETLGAVSVLCVDKTGTLTKNQMEVLRVWTKIKEDPNIFLTMGLACEPDTYDPMEKAILESCKLNGVERDSIFSGELLFEYPFTRESKMMGHVWNRSGQTILAAKGSPESILPLCNLDHSECAKIEVEQTKLATFGLRVIAIATAILGSDIPAELAQNRLEFVGLVGLADPPREAVPEAIKTCINAGIRVVMITGDNGLTATSIAGQIGLPCGEVITGPELNNMTDEELKKAVKKTNVFSRVIPEHKMRIVQALKANGEIVAMTGDGVNDAQALKYADIGIAMGGRGTEVAREAADLVLLDDNFTTIVDTVKDGRRIYANIKKAFGYVFAIHIPIALAALFAPLLGIDTEAIMLLPLHVVLLELVIDPTCSIVFEQQAADEQIMAKPPRNPKESLVTKFTLLKSLAQGLFIFAGSFGSYFCFITTGQGVLLARTIGFVVLTLSSLLLVLVNSSEDKLIFQVLPKLLQNRAMLIVSTVVIITLGVVIYTPLAGYLRLTSLSFTHALLAAGVAAVSVLWYEIVKLLRKKSNEVNSKYLKPD